MYWKSSSMLRLSTRVGLSYRHWAHHSSIRVRSPLIAKKKKKRNTTRWVVVDELISSAAIRSSAKIRGSLLRPIDPRAYIIILGNKLDEIKTRISYRRFDNIFRSFHKFPYVYNDMN